MTVASISEAIERYREGRFVIIVDDEDRENEGDLAIPAQCVTPEAIAFMARYASGLICVPMSGVYLDRLKLPMMVSPNNNGTRFGTAFTVSVEAREGVTTGISAHDRAHTIQVLTDPDSIANDIVQPGHVFPLRYAPGGVLERDGQTEASVDLALLAGFDPAAVICEIMNDDGTMARMPDLERFSTQHDIPIITIKNLIDYRRAHPLPSPPVEMKREAQIERLARVPLPTAHGLFTVTAYRESGAGTEQEPHLALVFGEIEGEDPILCRVHSECLTGDVFGSGRCDCGEQLQVAMTRIAASGRGVIVYLRQEGRGIGLINKLRAYEYQDLGFDTVEANHQLGLLADARDYRVAADILLDLGVSSVSLLTNNPAKIDGLKANGLRVDRQIPIRTSPNSTNIQYLQTKQDRLGHMLGLAGS
jgi:3,4-dihydroxy 2-butanone 4-phosphate synthase/GTP cyclohydrolase II